MLSTVCSCSTPSSSDGELLECLPRHDRRVEFIWDSISELSAALGHMGGGLTVLHGRMRNEVPRLAALLQAQAMYTNHDYEPDAVARDLVVQRALPNRGIALCTFKDQGVFEKDEVLRRDGRPFSVFTANRNAWLERLAPFCATAYPVEKYAASLARSPAGHVPALGELGFERSNLRKLRLLAGTSGGRIYSGSSLSRIDRYHERRDYPALKGPSYLSDHLRFGGAGASATSHVI